MSELKRTPLFDAHVALGARMVDFGGWGMPLQYPTGILAEHHAVRRGVGLFDVSHMGEIRVRGSQALAFLDWLSPNGVAALRPGRIHYTGLLTERGTFVDDILLHCFDERDFLLVVNASNAEKDLAWVREHATRWGVEVLDESAATGQLALQGPLGAEVLQPLVDVDLGGIRYYGFAQARFRELPAMNEGDRLLAGLALRPPRAPHVVSGPSPDTTSVLIARTGYTGEDGFEVYCPAERTGWVWEALLEAGRPQGIIPAGLGCRNTLRLEAGMALYGHEIDDGISPLEAGLDRILRFEKGDFLGREALLDQKARGLERTLVGFRMLGKGDIARDHMPVLEGGYVTSGAPSPSLGCNIGLALIPTGYAATGSRIHVEIRGRACPAELVPAPFYTR